MPNEQKGGATKSVPDKIRKASRKAMYRIEFESSVLNLDLLTGY